MFRHIITSVFIGLSVFLISLSLFAQSSGQQRGEKRGHRGPPPESIKACSSLSQGESCSFTGRGDKTMSGVCETTREGNELHCRPDGNPPEKRRGSADETEETKASQ